MRLIADNISGERGGEIIFSGIGFSLDDGGALVVTGPNGSGKSTLLRIVAGLLPAAAGSAAFEGGGDEWPTVAAACHYLGHRNAMKAALTVRENLTFWRDFHGAPSCSPAEALETVGLGAVIDLPFAYLSAGQRRRVAISRLLLNHRPLWLLDEPTAGLDKASERRFGELMDGHLGEGGIVVAATHLPLGLEGARELRLGAKDEGNA